MSRTAGIQRTLAIILLLNAVVVGVKLAVAMRTGNLTVLGATLESARKRVQRARARLARCLNGKLQVAEELA